MAVINDYVDSNIASGKLNSGALVNGGAVKVVPVTFEIAAADDDASIYRVLKDINPDLIPVKIELYTDAMTGATDYDLGIYLPLSEGGAEIDKDVFLDGKDVNAGNLKASPIDGMTNVNIANLQKKIFEHAGHTIATKKRGYDIAITANTVGSGAGTVTVVFYFIQG